VRRVGERVLNVVLPRQPVRAGARRTTKSKTSLPRLALRKRLPDGRRNVCGLRISLALSMPTHKRFAGRVVSSRFSPIGAPLDGQYLTSERCDVSLDGLERWVVLPRVVDVAAKVAAADDDR